MNFLRKKRLHNAGKPKGFWGRRTLRSMNEEHSDLTDNGLNEIPFKDDFTCLDIGCGGGRTISLLSEKAKNGKIYGVDISETSLKEAKRYNKADIKSGKITLKQASVNELPFPDDFFDVVTAVETFYFWKDKGDCVKEVKRVLKPGGVFMIMLDAYDDGVSDYSEVINEIGLELNTPDFFREIFFLAGYSETDIIIDGVRIYVRGRK